MLDSRFNPHPDGTCDPAAVVSGKNYRFTVLTDRMLRMEYSEDGIFTDRPTQTVWNRRFPVPDFSVTDSGELLEITTKYFHLYYDKKGFSKNHLYIDPVYSDFGERWYYGETAYGNPQRSHNLLGTARTLDMCDGGTYESDGLACQIPVWGTYEDRNGSNVDLGTGLCDKDGRTFFDDSGSMVIGEDGSIRPGKAGSADVYFLCYGHDYAGCIRDFYRLSGPVPMLPRYALGNWWSRYWKYTEKTYKELFERFESLDVPFSVSVIDMDWHLTDIPEKFGKGWTGYTWNREFFPDPERLMKWLHEHGCRIVLNLHPADGIRAFEEKYAELAEAMGIDPASEHPVAFDLTDEKFVNEYFGRLLRSLEDEGVDFWWIDWQQGGITAVSGLDPLWLLNHFHYYDSKRQDKRGLILSRYSGLGSHRYPVGFSGDTFITWKSLQYQPYFTATATNVGYTWWSHDIGGHHFGRKDHQLFVRWLQFGIFSPVNRLHSTANPFISKEPWNYPEPYRSVICETLRMRHRLLPYIYTMNYRCAEQLTPFIMPLYYLYPDDDRAYAYKNEYFFGSELLVQPMVHKADPETACCSEAMWLPPGTWTDFYTGLTYDGGKNGRDIIISRPMEYQGVLAKAGAIVPQNDTPASCNSLENPETLDIYVFPGADNSFELFEDSGDGYAYKDGRCVKTLITFTLKDGGVELTVKPCGDASVLPEKRAYRIHFRGFSDTDDFAVSEGAEKEYSEKDRTITLTTQRLSPMRELRVTLKGNLKYDRHDIKERMFEFLSGTEGPTALKQNIYRCICDNEDRNLALSSIMALSPPESWRNIITELLIG